MNYTLQIHGERSLYQVPPGLYELISDISREVLRDQPENLYKHIANYMDTLVKLRTDMKTAKAVVDDVITDNQELFAYVDARGLTWEEANRSARVIQRAYRRARAKKLLKERVEAERREKLKQTPILEHSPSFIEYFESLGVDYATANKASVTIQTAFKTFKAKQHMRSMDRGSTHSIDMVPSTIDMPVVLDKPTTRDSKLQIFQESPSPSVNSSWYRPVDEYPQRSSDTSTTSCHRPPDTRDPNLLVYQQSPSPSVDTTWYFAQRRDTDVSMEAKRLGLYKGLSFLDEEDAPDEPTHLTPTPTLEARVPEYFDTEQAKVPMISDSGQLEVEGDVITLFSTENLKVSKSFVGSMMNLDQHEKIDKLPSLKDLGGKPSQTDSETAKELFSVIGKKRSKGKSVSKRSLPSSSKLKTTIILSKTSLDDASHTDPGTLMSKASQVSNKSDRTPSGRPRLSSRILKIRSKASSDDFEREVEPE